MTENGKPPPRENLIRAVGPAELSLRSREDGADGDMPELHGHFAVFDEWTEINSAIEGRFLEKIAPGAFKKTIRENRDSMRVLFNHGRDATVGEKPLGPIVELSEDERGASYAVELLDTDYNRELIPGLERGLYGSSFRFEVMKEDFDPRPEKGDHNPDGLPERVVREARVPEFGPVTFPAYAGAGAGLRSMTDEFMLGNLAVRETATPPVGAAVSETPALGIAAAVGGSTTSSSTGTPIVSITGTSIPNQTVLADAVRAAMGGAPAGDAPTITEVTEPSHSTSSRDTRSEPEPTEETKHMNIEEMRARQDEIKSAMIAMDSEASGSLPAERQEEWDRLDAEYKTLGREVDDKLARRARVAELEGTTREEPVPPESSGTRTRRGATVPDNIYDVAEYRNRAFDSDDLHKLYADGAKRAIEIAVFPHEAADREKVCAHLERLLAKDGEDSEIARRILATGGPTYRRAFGKTLTGTLLSPEETRALSLTAGSGGYAVPIQIDPTVIPVSNGVVNPIRAIARTETMTGAEFRAVTSDGITAAYSAEVTEAGDNAPALLQPIAYAEKAQAFVPFSIEIGQDWGALESEMAKLLADAKDALEANKFIHGLGHGSNQPEGLLVGGTAIVSTAAATTFAVADLYSLEEALPPRFRPRARFVANKKQFNRVRQFDTAGGANLWERLGADTPAELIGYPAHEASEMVSTITSASSILTFGDFSHLLVADRVGMSVEIIPHMFHTSNNRPSGQRGLYAYWRNTSKVLSFNAFRTLKVT